MTPCACLLDAGSWGTTVVSLAARNGPTRRRGMGDLVAACISLQSRNRHVGEQLGRGRKIDEITSEMHMVAEGVKTTRVVLELAERVGIPMPVAREVHGALYEGGTAREAYRGLVRNKPGDEAEPG